MSDYQYWLTRFKRKLKLFNGRTAQKLQANPPMIVDDSLNLLSSLKNSSIDKVKGFVDEFNKALPVIEEAGYKLRTVEIRLGIPPKLIPHFDQITELSAAEKETLMLSIKDKRYTRMLLSTLFKSSEMQQGLQIGNLPAGVIQIELTAVPNIILVYGEY